MSLEDLGNLGEFLAAIGVIVTLVYLAIQIRQNTRMMRASIRQSRSDGTQQAYTATANGVMPEIMDKDARNEPLTELEQRRMLLWHIGSWRSRETIFLQAMDGLLDDSTLETQAEVIRQVMRSPYARSFFDDQKDSFDPRFRVWVEGVLAALDAKEP